MFLVRKFISTLRLMGTYFVANTQTAMEYRSAFIVQILAMAANDSLWLFFWWSYFQRFPLSNGWHTPDIVILWAVSACGFGISMAVFGNARQLASLIMTGGLDAYLGMPRYALLHVCIAATDPTAWGDIVFACGAYLLFLRPDPLHMILFVVFALLSSMIFTAFLVILGSLAFFLGNTEGMAQQLLGALVSFSTYPMDIFRGAVKLLLFTVVPAGFVSFVPLQLLHHFSIPLFAGLLGFTALFVAIAAGVFQLGVRRYESGNLLGMQN